MVSLMKATPVTREKKKETQNFEISMFKKRRREEEEEPKGKLCFDKLLRNSSSSGVDLHLDYPLPSEWQRCLDIKSGEIYFYNTLTRLRTSTDPREPRMEKVPPPSLAANLDLELSLSLAAAFDGGDHREMVAAACLRCHMLVMMFKMSPTCPNCRFVHQPPTTAAKLL